MIFYPSSAIRSTKYLINKLGKQPDFLKVGLESYGVKANTLEKVVEMESIYSKSFMMDSGAFTVYQGKKNITLNDYMAFIKDVTNAIPNNHIVWTALDVIGDSEATFNNYKIMIKNGLNVVPVWHNCDDYKHLELYTKTAEIVGLSFLDIKGRHPLEDKVFKDYPGIKFHLYGTLPEYCHPYWSFDLALQLVTQSYAMEYTLKNTKIEFVRKGSSKIYKDGRSYESMAARYLRSLIALSNYAKIHEQYWKGKNYVYRQNT